MDLEKEFSQIGLHQGSEQLGYTEKIIKTLEVEEEALQKEAKILQTKIYILNLYGFCNAVELCFNNGSFSHYEIDKIRFYYYFDDYSEEQLDISFIDKNKQERTMFFLKDSEEHLANIKTLCEWATKIIRTNDMKSYFHDNFLSDRDAIIEINQDNTQNILNTLLTHDLQKLFHYATLKSQLEYTSNLGKKQPKVKI